MRDQPVAFETPAADGRAHPGFREPGLGKVFVTLVDVEHIDESNVASDGDSLVTGLEPDLALIFIEPAQEIPPHRIKPSETLERGNHIEIDDVGRIERHEPVDILFPAGLGAAVE